MAIQWNKRACMPAWACYSSGTKSNRQQSGRQSLPVTRTKRPQIVVGHQVGRRPDGCFFYDCGIGWLANISQAWNLNLETLCATFESMHRELLNRHNMKCRRQPKTMWKSNALLIRQQNWLEVQESTRKWCWCHHNYQWCSSKSLLVGILDHTLKGAMFEV